MNPISLLLKLQYVYLNVVNRYNKYIFFSFDFASLFVLPMLNLMYILV